MDKNKIEIVKCQMMAENARYWDIYAPFYKYKNGVASPMTLNMVEQHARNVGRIYTPAMTKLGSA